MHCSHLPICRLTNQPYVSVANIKTDVLLCQWNVGNGNFVGQHVRPVCRWQSGRCERGLIWVINRVNVIISDLLVVVKSPDVTPLWALSSRTVKWRESLITCSTFCVHWITLSDWWLFIIYANMCIGQTDRDGEFFLHPYRCADWSHFQQFFSIHCVWKCCSKL